jgi:hypothetical protein
MGHTSNGKAVQALVRVHLPLVVGLGERGHKVGGLEGRGLDWLCINTKRGIVSRLRIYITVRS